MFVQLSVQLHSAIVEIEPNALRTDKCKVCTAQLHFLLVIWPEIASYYRYLRCYLLQYFSRNQRVTVLFYF